MAPKRKAPARDLRQTRSGPGGSAYREEDTDSTGPVEEPALTMGGQGQPPPQFVAASPVDYTTIAAIVAQAVQQTMQQAIPQLQPQVIVQAPVPPLPQKGTTDYFKAMKVAGIAVFSGGSDPIRASSWIEEVEGIFELHDVPEDARVKVIIPFLVGEASGWWKSTSTTLRAGGQPVTWVKFKEVFLNHFFPMSVRKQKAEEFYRLKQTAEMSVVEYAHQFQLLGQFVPEVMDSEIAKMHHFKDGLISKIQSGIALLQPATFQAMYDTAISIEADMKRKAGLEGNKKVKFGAPPVHGNRPPFRHGQQFRQGFQVKPGQSSSVPRLPQQGIRPLGLPAPQANRGVPLCGLCQRYHMGECHRKTGACFTCGKTGHMMRNCPTMGMAMGQASGSQGRPGEDKKKTNARVFALTQEDADTSGDVVTGEE